MSCNARRLYIKQTKLDYRQINILLTSCVVTVECFTARWTQVDTNDPILVVRHHQRPADTRDTKDNVISSNNQLPTNIS
jgi:hypothetical protein